MSSIPVALSILDPWGTACAMGLKPVENRDWPTSFRGRFMIHVGQGQKEMRDASVWEFIRELVTPEQMEALRSECARRNRIRTVGRVIGSAELVDCVTESADPWFMGKYGLVLARPRLYPEPVPCTGRLGFFDVPAQVVRAVRAQLASPHPTPLPTNERGE
ncbi:MAG: hypothetical protein WD533_06530 [Dehalococcoidia bacterium]